MCGQGPEGVLRVHLCKTAAAKRNPEAGQAAQAAANKCRTALCFLAACPLAVATAGLRRAGGSVAVHALCTVCAKLGAQQASLALCADRYHHHCCWRCLTGGDRVPLPPCIRVGESGNCEVTLEIEDRQQHATIAKITADAVRVHLTGNASHGSAQQELLALMAKTLTLRPTQLTLLQGSSSRNRVLVVEMLTTRQVYARLRGIPMPQRRQDQPGSRKPKPWHHGL